MVARQAVVVAPGFTASANLLAGRGAKPVDQVVHGAVRGTHVPADPTGLTEVAGVAGVTGLADFANPDLTLALCAREVPCGAAGITRSRTPSNRTTLAGDAAPGHVANVRQHVIDALSDDQVDQLAEIADAILARLDPAGSMAATYTRYDAAPEFQERQHTAAG